MISRTLNAIIEGFNKLIENTDFNKISVDMIMQEAGVSRSTFYRYFKDKYEVMNANYKMALDYYIRRALESTGFNSLSNFIYEYSYEMALKITRLNRDGRGFTPAEELQVDVFCNGICAVYRNIIRQRYQIDPSAAADALYEMMPESLKHYWWK